VVIGAVEAKDKLGMLLDRVECGEEIIITRHGKPIARLVPHATRIDKLQTRAALERIRTRAGDLTEAFDRAAVRADRDAGRP
jgi:prevent-host-death family protein